MKKLLLIALVAGGLMFTGAPRSDAGVSVGIGFGFPVAYLSICLSVPLRILWTGRLRGTVILLAQRTSRSCRAASSCSPCSSSITN